MNMNTSTDTNTNSKWKWAEGNTCKTKESNRINQSSQSSNQRGNDHSIPSHLFLHSATLIIETESNNKPSQDTTIAIDTRFLAVTSNSSQQNLCTKFQFSASHCIASTPISNSILISTSILIATMSFQDIGRKSKQQHSSTSTSTSPSLSSPYGNPSQSSISPTSKYRRGASAGMAASVLVLAVLVLVSVLWDNPSQWMMGKAAAAAVQAMNILPLVKLFWNIRYVVHCASCIICLIKLQCILL